MDLIIEKLDKLQTLLESLSVLEKSVFSLEEAAQYLQLSKSALYKLISNGEIPYSKPGGKRIYIQRTALDKWILSSTVPSMQNVSDEVNTFLSLKS